MALQIDSIAGSGTYVVGTNVTLDVVASGAEVVSFDANLGPYTAHFANHTQLVSNKMIASGDGEVLTLHRETTANGQVVVSLQLSAFPSSEIMIMEITPDHPGVPLNNAYNQRNGYYGRVYLNPTGQIKLVSGVHHQYRGFEVHTFGPFQSIIGNNTITLYSSCSGLSVNVAGGSGAISPINYNTIKFLCAPDYSYTVNSLELHGDYWSGNAIEAHLGFTTTSTIIPQSDYVYSWKKDGVQISTDRTVSFVSDLDDSGSYTVDVTAGNETVSSLPQLVTVHLKSTGGTFTSSYNVVSYRESDPKDAISIVEKIARLAELNDPWMMDYENIPYYAEKLGYPMDITSTDMNYAGDSIDGSEVYKRNITSMLPTLYSQRTTKESIRTLMEMFGVIGDTIQYFTLDYDDEFNNLVYVENFDDYMEYLSNTTNPKIRVNWKSTPYNPDKIETDISSIPNDFFSTPHIKVLFEYMSLNETYHQGSEEDVTRNQMIPSIFERLLNEFRPANVVLRGVSKYVVTQTGMYIDGIVRNRRYIKLNDRS